MGSPLGEQLLCARSGSTRSRKRAVAAMNSAGGISCDAARKVVVHLNSTPFDRDAELQIIDEHSGADGEGPFPAVE